MTEYASQAQIEAQLQRSLNSYEVTQLTTLLPMVREWIDDALDTTFQPASPSTRVFDGGDYDRYFDAPSSHKWNSGRNTVHIDPCQNVTDVSYIDPMGITSPLFLDTTMYVLEPVNEAIKTEIRARYGNHFPVGEQNIQVTATFTEYQNGVPEDIQQVASRLAAALIQESLYVTQSGNMQMEKLEGHEVRYQQKIPQYAFQDPIIQAILGRRRPVLI